MDPLSVTLSVVTLTTAVKDLVEVGQKIHESFAKVSNNFRSAQLVAAEIKEMLEEIQVFCQDHQDVLADMKDFRLALQSLLDKFRSFERSILPLLPQTGGSKRVRLLRGWAAWRDNNKIEKSILDLQSDIVKVIRKYIMKSAMRNEVKLETVHRETSKGIKDIHQDMSQGFEVLEVVRRDVSALRTIPTSSAYQPLVSGPTTDDLVRNIIMFATSTPSTSAPMFRAPDIITEELMTTAYIKLQIKGIVTSLKKISKTAASASNSITLDTVEKFQTTLILDHTWMSTASLLRHVVQQVTSIRDLLDDDLDLMQVMSIRDGARALNKLSLGLGSLGMRRESILVGNWAIALARILVDSSCDGQLDLRADLAQYLLDQYTTNGNSRQGEQSIEEAYTLSQDLRNQDPQDIHFKILHSSVLLQYAKFLKTRQFRYIRFREMTSEAIQILEEILNVQAWTQSGSDGQYRIKQVVYPSATFLNSLFSSAPPITALRNYALALQQLADCFPSHYRSYFGTKEDHLTRLAVAVHRNIVSIHGDVHKVDLAIALSFPARSLKRQYGQRERVNMIDEGIQLLRSLVEKNSLSSARQKLVSVMWARSRWWSSDIEAMVFLEEALADRHFRDSKWSAGALRDLSHCFRRLTRYDDAIRTRKLQLAKRSTHMNEALAYFHLSKDLLQTQCYQESTEAARSSVALFRRLAIRYSRKTWVTNYLAEALSNLARCMAASANYTEASSVWKSCMDILDSSLVTKPKEMDITAFDHYPRFSYILQDEECLTVCSTALRYLRQLSQIHDSQFITSIRSAVDRSLFRAEFCYSYNLVRIGRLVHGQQYIEDWLDTYHEFIKRRDIYEDECNVWYSRMSNLRADCLDAQGYTEQAVLLQTQDAQRISWGDFTYTIHPIFGPTSLSIFPRIIPMVQEARLRVNLDSGEEALRVAEAALQYFQDHKPHQTVESLAWSLHGVAFTALSIQNYARAAEAAREGCSLCSSADWKTKDDGCNGVHWESNDQEPENEWGEPKYDEGEYDILLRPGLFAFLSSAEANLGRYGNGVEYARRAVEISLDIQNRKAFISATTAESAYMETRGNLAEVLLTIGDFAQARQICEERRAYFSKRVETRTGEYRDLATILHMLGILYCNEGRHEEGNSAMEELLGIVKKLGIIFPTLGKQVKNRLRNRLRVPILKVLEDMRLKLDCEHQEDIELLWVSREQLVELDQLNLYRKADVYMKSENTPGVAPTVNGARHGARQRDDAPEAAHASELPRAGKVQACRRTMDLVSDHVTATH